MGVINFPSPHRAAIRQGASKTMEIILHLGAHRTASTSFQHYLRRNAETLAKSGIGVWGPLRTRDGLLTGVVPASGSPRAPAQQLARATGRVSIALTKAEQTGTAQLVVSDENMLGAPRRNLRHSALYDDAGQRMARFAQAFGPRVTRVVLSIRAQDSYWGSALAFAVARGHRVPRRDDLDRLVTSPRHWRDVIADVACACPGADIHVLPYEVFGGQPERKLQAITGQAKMPRKHARAWLNRAPTIESLRAIVAERGGHSARLGEGEGRWQPFDAAQAAALRESYADDLFWLRAGADGLATLIEETEPGEAGTQPPLGQTTRGHSNDDEERRMA